MILFDRKVKLRIIPQAGGAIEVEGLRISFSIDKTSTRHPNKASIEVYNLSRDHAATCEDPNTTFELFAGYGDNVSLIFRGQAKRGEAKTLSNGVDRVTQIDAGSGARYYASAKINRSFGADVTYRQVIEEISKTFGGIKMRLPKEINFEERITGSSTFSGRSADALTELGESLGFDWFDDDGVLVITSKNGDTGQQVVSIGPETGLVGGVVKTSKGIEATSLLNPLIQAKRLVEIQTPEVKGFFRVTEVSHKGTSGGYSKEFYTEFKAVQIGTK